MENIVMSWSRQNLTFYVLVLTGLISSTACSAWIIEPNDSCTWGIPNGDLPIPAGFIPVGAKLTLHGIDMDQVLDACTLNLYLLSNPAPGLIPLTEDFIGDPFEGYGIPIGAV